MKANTNKAPPAEASGKSREEIKAEREAKKLAKQNARKNKSKETIDNVAKPEKSESVSPSPPVTSKTVEEEKENMKTREEVIAERTAKKQSKKSGDKKPSTTELGSLSANKTDPATEVTEAKSKAQLKAERRAKQEAQRAKKAEVVVVKKEVVKLTTAVADSNKAKPRPSPKKVIHAVDTFKRVKLFAHLYAQMEPQSRVLIGVEDVHPSIARLGAQYRTRVVCGSNARCLALLNALKRVISEYQTPAKEELGRGLDAELTRSMSFLQKCRPVSVSMTNAVKHLRAQVLRCKGQETEVKQELLEWIETYVKDQLEKAAEAISMSVRGKIANGDVILTYSCSSLIQKILTTAAQEGIRFRVIVVDGRPWLEGRETLRRLLLAGIHCTYILVNALSFVMPDVTKILLGAHALLANGYVMSRCGSSQIALLGRAYNVPVLVCCETHKFSERVQTDSFVHNELGDPDDLMNTVHLTPLNLTYDVTPPDLVSAVVTELAVLPCTSVPKVHPEANKKYDR